VTELIDADSIGIHSILASIATELDASILFTPEFSHKAHDSVNELKTASMMMILAEKGERTKRPGNRYAVDKGEKAGVNFGDFRKHMWKQKAMKNGTLIRPDVHNRLPMISSITVNCTRGKLSYEIAKI